MGCVVLEAAIEQSAKDIRAVVDKRGFKLLGKFYINGDAVVFTIACYKDGSQYACNVAVSGYEARRNSEDELLNIVRHKAEVACATIAKAMAGE